MPVNSADLWRLLRQSHLLPPERLEEIRRAFASAGNEPHEVPAEVLAQWLLHQKLLSRYQVKLLLNGRAGPFRYGDYRVEDRVTRGRLSKTFLAVHVPSHHPVMLKFAPQRLAQDPRQWNTARQSIRSMTNVVHDQLQRVFVGEEQAGYRFLVLERLEGKCLAARLAAEKRLLPSQACRFASLIAEGLAAIHAHGQVYGDVRLDNVWREPSGNVKLVRDSFLPPQVPATWQTPMSEDELERIRYLAPELAHPGTPLSVATDLYAFGCTLYRLLEGRPPFVGENGADILRQHATGPVPAVAAQELPKPLESVLRDLLAKQPEQRPAGAEEVAMRLRPLIDEPLQAGTESRAGATLQAYEQALQGDSSPAPPAPPPVIPEADDRPRIPEPPIQTAAASSPPAPKAELTASSDSVLVDLPTSSPPHIPIGPEPRHRRRQRGPSRRRRAITLSILAAACFVLVAGIVAVTPSLREALFGPSQTGSTDKRAVADAGKGGLPPRRGDPDSGDSRLVAGEFDVRSDNGELLWMTPTKGLPVDLKCLAPGAHFLLVARPQAILRGGSGKQVLQTLGPEFAGRREELEEALGVQLKHIKRLRIAVHLTESGPASCLLVRLEQPRTRESLLDSWGTPDKKTYEDHHYYVAKKRAFYVPRQDSISTFVTGSEELVRAVIERRDKPPLLRRELAQLLESSDNQRHLSLFFAPEILTRELILGASDALLPYPQRLRKAIEWLLNDQVQAGSLSLHLGDTFYLELRAKGHTGTDSQALAESLRTRVGEAPEAIESLFARAYPGRYWRRVAIRFPEMVRFAHRYTRVGVEEGQAIVNAALPGSAAHNLVFGSVMLLQAPWDMPPSDRMITSAPSVDAPGSLEELLRREISLSFDQQSLEFAIRDLAAAIRSAYPGLAFELKIDIVGSDLQRDGITRNQQIEDFQTEEMTIGEILTALVQEANPVADVDDPKDSEQKLIWVVAPATSEQNKRVLLITTRAAATREGYKLPAPFQPE